MVKYILNQTLIIIILLQIWFIQNQGMHRAPSLDGNMIKDYCLFSTPIIDENTDAWILTEFENVALFYAASLDMLRLSNTLDAEKILEGGIASTDATSKTSLSAIHWLEDEDSEMAQAVLQVSQGDLAVANQRLQTAISYYQRAIAELQSITGALGAPEQQQQSQRQQQGATS